MDKGYRGLSLILLLALILQPGISTQYAEATAAIWADKKDYQPYETVIIHGSGFNPQAYYDIPVVRPDGTIVKGDGSNTLGWDTVQADENGGFTYHYQLNGIEGVYEVRVYNSPWSGQLSEVPLATTTFTDSQQQLEKLWGWDKKSGRWKTGQITGWMEDDYVNYRLEISNFPGGTLTFHINLDHTRSSVTGLDKAVQFYVGDGKGEADDPQNAITIYIGPIVDRDDPLSVDETASNSTTNGTLSVKRLPNGPGKAGDSALRYQINVTTSLKNWFVYWESHLANGSSAWPGASLHVYTDEFGRKDVPIQSPPSSLGTITGYKVHDLDGDGSWDEGEPTLSGWNITITNGTYTASMLTIGDGSFRFTGLSPGDYTVYEELQLGWTNTTTSCVKVTLSSNEIKTVNFLNFKLGKISGYKWKDLDGDGVWDDGEPGLEGWNITLSGPINSTVQTNASGYYEFVNLINGTYIVGEELQEGWTRTCPADGTYLIIIQSGTESKNNNFGNYMRIPPAELGIFIEKKANVTSSHVGDVIKYTYNITNTGNAPFLRSNVTVTDNVTSPVVYESGDNNNNDELDPGESWIYNATYTVTDSTPDPLVNNATVTATYNDQTVSAWDTHSIDILHPKISITKEANATQAYAGDIINYTIVVENTGDCTLYNINVTDSKLGLKENIEYLMSGENETYTILYMVKVRDPDPLNNIVMVEGVDELGMKVSDEARCSVDLVAKICGYKFNDTNNNGTRDEGENGLAGWTIQLFKWNETKGAWDWVANTTTDLDGSYHFDMLDAGNYTVIEVLENGWTNTTPASIIIELDSGEISLQNNFGNIELGNICGYKIHDLDGDGEPDPGEPGLGGWTIILYNASDGSQISSTATASDGYYNFTHLLPGAYWVNETLQDGWTQTSGNYRVTIQPGESVIRNFTNFKWFKVSGYKKDTLGSPLSGWNITLHRGGELYAWTTTDASGYYEFTVKDPGNYIIKEWLKANWTSVSPTYQVGDSTNDVEVEGHSFTAVSGQDKTGLNFTNFQWIKISGYKLNHTSQTGIGGWTIKLYNGSVVYGFTTTSNDGYYEFIVKDPGTYRIVEVLTANWTMTYPHIEYGEPNHDKEVRGYDNINVESGINIYDMNFTNFQWFKVSGYKLNTSGVGLEGWTIKLYNNSQVYSSTATDSAGYYEFTVKDPGTYRVVEVLLSGWTAIHPFYQVGSENGEIEVTGYTGITSGAENLNFTNFKWVIVSGCKFEDIYGNQTVSQPLSGWVINLYNETGLYASTYTNASGCYEFIVKDPGTYNISEEVNEGWIQTYPGGNYTFTAQSGVDVTGKDFWNFKLGVISGYKWSDTSGEGYWNTTETGIGNWNITLYKWNGTDWELEATTPTDSNGRYEFYGLEAGNYSIVEELTSGWRRTYPQEGYYNFTVTSGFNRTDNNFGNQQLVPPQATISGVKFHDKDADGQRDDDEEGLENWEIKLFKWNETGQTWDPIATYHTGQDGYYIFSIIGSGKYKICEVPQQGWFNSTPTCYEFVINQNGDFNKDFGNFKLGSITGFKFEDKDGDGELDEGEPKVQGWNITITNGTYTASMLTNSSGAYEFTGLWPGTYWVNETLQGGWIQTSGNYSIRIASNQTITNLNFGNFKVAIVEGYKWNDLDGDGIWDTGEPGLGGWTIKAKKGSSEKTAVTNSSGYYRFTFGPTELNAWIIYEEPQQGWMQTAPSGGNYSVIITSGAIHSYKNFGNKEMSIAPQTTISGVKFNDKNGNGIRDWEEEGLEGWVIQLWKKEGSNWRLIGQTTTGPMGNYIFTLTETNHFRLVEVQRDGWVQTAPKPNGYCEFTFDGSKITIISGDFHFGNRLAPVGGELLPLDFLALTIHLVTIVAIFSTLALTATVKRRIK